MFRSWYSESANNLRVYLIYIWTATDVSPEAEELEREQIVRGGENRRSCNHRRLELQHLDFCNAESFFTKNYLHASSQKKKTTKKTQLCLLVYVFVVSYHFEIWRWSHVTGLWGPSSMACPRAWIDQWRNEGKRKEWWIASAIVELQESAFPSSVLTLRRIRTLVRSANRFMHAK